MPEWTPDEVRAYLLQRSVPATTTRKVHDAAISGNMLTTLTAEERKQLLQELGLSMLEIARVASEIALLLKNGYNSTAGALQSEMILEGKTPSSDGKRPDLRVRVVDFAGQMEYYVTHQLFMSDLHSLYVLLSSAVEPGGEPKNAASIARGWSYWLGFLAGKFGAGSRTPAMLALTQLDRAWLPPNPDVKPLLAEFADGSKFACEDSCFGINYESTQATASVGRLQQALHAAVASYCASVHIPASYARLSSQVRLWREKLLGASPPKPPVVAKAEFFEMIDSSEAKIAADSQLLELAMLYLSGSGEIFMDKRLDVVVLDPIDWMARRLSLFIREEGLAPIPCLRGVVKQEDVVLFLGNDEAEALLSVMSQLELCIKMEGDGGCYVLPCALPAAAETELKREWTDAATALPVLHYIGRRIESDGKHAMIPPGAFSTAQVRLVNQLRPRKYCLWRGTAILVFPNAHLRVDLVPARASVSAVARGEPGASRALLHSAVDCVLAVLCSMFELKLRVNGFCPLCLLTNPDPASACTFALTDARSPFKLQELFFHFKYKHTREESVKKSSADVAFSLVAASPFCHSKSSNMHPDDVLQGVCDVAAAFQMVMHRFRRSWVTAGDFAP